MNRGKNQVGWWIGISICLHAVIILGISPFDMSSIGARIDSHIVELVGKDTPSRPPDPEVEPVVMVARLGAHRAPLRGHGVDALARNEDPGTIMGQGAASARKRLTSGEDTSDLTTTPMSHPDLNLHHDAPSRQRTVTADTRDDELEPTPFLTSGPASPSSHVSSVTRPVPGAAPSARASRDLPPAPDSRTAIGETRGKTGEQMSRIPKDGATTPAVPRLDPSVTGLKQYREMMALARKSARRTASSKRVSDLMHAARPQASGRSTGRGSGTTSTRRGSLTGKAHGKTLWLTTGDRRYVDYFQGIYRKVNPLWLFPKELEIMKEQGDVLVQFTILADGAVRNVKVRKSSGYAKFDKNVIVAINKAAPFRPIPSGLGKKLEVLAPFEFSNPMVQ